jgi:hypothetical protein
MFFSFFELRFPPPVESPRRLLVRSQLFAVIADSEIRMAFRLL